MNEIKHIPLSLIYTDGRNPRKKFSEEAIKELSESIEKQGLLQPITVRPTPENKGTYTIVCGERRYRAYKLMSSDGTATIPAIVREMNAIEAFDAMITENLQRKDVNPAEEGRAFMELSKRMSVKEIASRFGKSEQFVRQRLRLSALIPHLVNMIDEETLPVSYALLLSRFSFEMQREIYDDILADPDSSRFPSTLKSFEGYINARYMMYIDNALFDAKSGDKPCNQCTCNTANQGLFDEYKGEEARCTDRNCFAKKQLNAAVDTAIAMHKEGYVVVMQDCYGNAELRERLDAKGIGYSVNYLRYSDAEPTGENEVKAVLLYGYQGYCKKIGKTLLDIKKSVDKITKTNAEKILELKKEDENNARIKDDNTVKDLRAMFADSEYYKDTSSYDDWHIYAIMVMDLPKYMQEHLGVGEDILGFCKTRSAVKESQIQRCWAQHRLDTINVQYNSILNSCLHDISEKHYPDEYKEICSRYDAVYQQRKERLEARYKDLGISLEDITQEMIDAYEAKFGKVATGYKGKKEYMKIVSRVTKENAQRLEDIQHKYGFKSNYEISQYLMHCFLRVADPDNDPILEPVPEEIVDMFEGLSEYGAMKFDKPKRRIPSNKED